MLKTNSKDRPLAAQLVGSDAVEMLDAAQILLDVVPGISFLDINSACPVKKVVKKKAGAYLLKSPDTLIKMVKKLTSKLRLRLQ